MESGIPNCSATSIPPQMELSFSAFRLNPVRTSTRKVGLKRCVKSRPIRDRLSHLVSESSQVAAGERVRRPVEPDW